ncbi:MAG: dipeptidase [Stackebrandtia sp.]
MSESRLELRTAVDAAMPAAIEDLKRLARIPSVAFDGFDHSQVGRSADAVAELLRGAGLDDVRIVTATGPSGKTGQPAVIGHKPAPPGAPTVLLYAHHDVQPAGDPGDWEQDDPFEPELRGERLFGRGCADDKAGVMAHVTALRAFGDRLPVGVTVFVEGEEEFGSDSLENLITEHRDVLAADVIVIADSANWDVGHPALTTSLRGVLNAYVEVRTLNQAVHSGMFGGPVPDALTVLCRLMATLHDDNGDVAIEGLVSGEAAPLDMPEGRLRAEAGMVDGVEFIGTGRLVERLWTKPTATVLGIDAPGAQESANALQPAARAKVSLRLAPGDDHGNALAALERHLAARVPWGAQLTVTLDHGGNPCVIDARGERYDAARAAFAEAWDGVEPVDAGIGGAIPFIATFQEMFPDAAILVTGVEDPDSRAHGPNESLHLEEFTRACRAEALLLLNLSEL